MNTQQFDPNQFQGELVVNSSGIADGMLVMTLGFTAIFFLIAIGSVVWAFRTKNMKRRLRLVGVFWSCLVVAGLFFIMPKVAQFPRESLWAYVKLGQTITWLAAAIIAFRMIPWSVRWVITILSFLTVKPPKSIWDDKLKFALFFAAVFVFVGWTYPWLLSLAMN